MKATNRTTQTTKCLLFAGCAIAAFLPALATAQTGDAAEPAVEETDHRPEKFSAGRYRGTFSTSAFEREILPPAKVDNKPPPTPFDLKVVGVTGEEGRYRVTLVDKKGKYVVVTDQPNADGYRYSALEPAANIADFRVQIAKDNQTEWAEFDDKRYSIASKAIAASKKTARPTGRPNVVPNVRKPPPSRTATPQTKSAASQKSGQAAIKAINAASAKAISEQGTDKSKSRCLRAARRPTTEDPIEFN